MARKVWPAEVRERALAIYVDQGAEAASAETGVGAGTIRSWASRNGAAARCNENRRARVEATKLRWAERRAVMVEEIGAAAHMALAQTVNALAEGLGTEAKNLATTMAILVDKAQLLSGDATARHFVTAEAREGVVDGARDSALRLVG